MIGDKGYYYIEEFLKNFKLSKEIKNMRRDFSDGVLFAEIIKQIDYKIININNYVPTLNSKQKIINWQTLKKKVFKILKLEITDEEIDNICKCQPFYIENALLKLAESAEKYLEEKKQKELIIQNNSFNDNLNQNINQKLTFNQNTFYKNEIEIRKQKINELQNILVVFYLFYYF